MNDTLLKIAQQYLPFDTYEVRGRDCLDFHVGSVVRALEAAYQAGLDVAETKKKTQK